MKNLNDLIRLTTLTIIMIGMMGLFTTHLKAQNTLNITAGYSLMEGKNIGVRYQLDQMQIGLVVGTGLDNATVNNKSFSVSGDWYYHFHGVSNLSIRRLWYGKVSISYFTGNMYDSYGKGLYISACAGRDFNISKRLGIDLEAGLSSGGHIPIYPYLGVSLFFRI